MRHLIFLILIYSIPEWGIAQPIAGTTGLLNVPTANMQNDGTFYTGVNYLPEALTPSTWDYNTYNYYFNFTFLPFLELSYRLTLFKLDEENRFNNQDRSIAVRIQILKENKSRPSLVLGVNDVFSSEIKLLGSKYYSSIYAVGTKDFKIKRQNFQATIGYSNALSNEEAAAGIFAGLTYTASFLPSVKTIFEYDTKVFNVGASVLLFKHLYLYGMAHEIKRFAGGFAYLIYLKN